MTLSAKSSGSFELVGRLSVCLVGVDVVVIDVIIVEVLVYGEESCIALSSECEGGRGEDGSTGRGAWVDVE